METPLRWVVKETWLSRKPSANGFFVSAMVTASLAVMSLLYWNDIFGALHWMPASGGEVFEKHQFWRLFTALFAHADEKHLVSNSFLFFVLGGFLNGYFRSFLFPILAFFFGALTNVIVLKTMSPTAHLLGASGIVFWMGGAWLTLYYLIDIRRSHRQRILRSLGVALVLFFPAEAFDPQTSYLSHLIGFIFGVAAGGAYYWHLAPLFQSAIQTEMVQEIHDEPILVRPLI